MSSIPSKTSTTIHERMCRLGSFPKGERSTAYQDYYMDGQWYEGSRRIAERSATVGFAPKPGETVVEVGCCTGGFLQFAILRGARKCVGIDVDADYIALAKELAQGNNHNITYAVADATAETTTTWLLKECDGKVDHLLLMSMGKHIGETTLWRIVDTLSATHTYIETNALGKVTRPYLAGVHARGGEFIGETDDRNKRILYRIDKPATT